MTCGSVGSTASALTWWAGLPAEAQVSPLFVDLKLPWSVPIHIVPDVSWLNRMLDTWFSAPVPGMTFTQVSFMYFHRYPPCPLLSAPAAQGSCSPKGLNARSL